MTRRSLHAVNALLLLALTGASVLAWPGLPEEIPIHFGAAGEPDSWADTTLLSWFGLPAISVLLSGGLYLVAAVLPSRPGWINLRDKARFLDLPEEARTPVYRRAQALTYFSVTLALLVMVLVQLAVYWEAHGSSAQPLVAAVLVVTAAGSLVISILAIVGMQRALEECWRRAQIE